MMTSPSGQGILTAFSRITVAAPTSSSTVLPLAASPTSNPPICASLASPDMMCINASRDSDLVKSSRRQSFSRISCRGTDMSIYSSDEVSFDYLRPRRCGGDEGGRTLPKFIPIHLPHMLHQSLHRLRLRQRHDASAKSTTGHACPINSLHLHRLTRQKIQLRRADFIVIAQRLMARHHQLSHLFILLPSQ